MVTNAQAMFVERVARWSGTCVRVSQVGTVWDRKGVAD